MPSASSPGLASAWCASFAGPLLRELVPAVPSSRGALVALGTPIANCVLVCVVDVERALPTRACLVDRFDAPSGAALALRGEDLADLGLPEELEVLVAPGSPVGFEVSPPRVMLLSPGKDRECYEAALRLRHALFCRGGSFRLRSSALAVLQLLVLGSWGLADFSVVARVLSRLDPAAETADY